MSKKPSDKAVPEEYQSEDPQGDWIRFQRAVQGALTVPKEDVLKAIQTEKRERKERGVK